MKKLLFSALSFLIIYYGLWGCSSQRNTEVATEDLKNTRWKLIEINSKSVTDTKKDIFIIFNINKNEFNGFGGCNNIFGDYEYDGIKLKISNIGMTKMNCPDEEDKYEYDLLDALKNFDSHKIIQKYLYLYKGNKVLAKFEAVFL